MSGGSIGENVEKMLNANCMIWAPSHPPISISVKVTATSLIVKERVCS